MTRARSTACCVWVLGAAIAVTALYSGLDHWGRFFPKRLGQHAQMPLDIVAESPLSRPVSACADSIEERGARCICSHCRCIRQSRCDDDYTGDHPDEPAGDRLTMWLCDDDGGQKQFGLCNSPGDDHWLALFIDSAAKPPADDRGPSLLSLNSLHVRLQI